MLNVNPAKGLTYATNNPELGQVVTGIFLACMVGLTVAAIIRLLR